MKGVVKDSIDFQIRCSGINISMIPSDVCVCSWYFVIVSFTSNISHMCCTNLTLEFRGKFV